MRKIFYILPILLLLISCNNPYSEINFQGELPEFEAEIISLDDPVYISINTLDTIINVFYKGAKVELDSLINYAKWKEFHMPPVLLFIDKNEKMINVFKLEDELRKRSLIGTYYVSGINRSSEENSFYAIGRKLQNYNQAGKFMNYPHWIPIPPSIDNGLLDKPTILFELKGKTILVDGKEIVYENIDRIIYKELKNSPDLFVLYHIGYDVIYDDFTRFISKENKAFMKRRDSVSNTLYGKRIDELDEVEMKIIKNKAPVRSMRINDKELYILKDIIKLY